VLGQGRRLFAAGFAHTTMKLAGAKPTANGSIVATYHVVQAT
jgi:hypothetical protein